MDGGDDDESMGGKGTFVVIALPNLVVTQTLAANQIAGGGGTGSGGGVSKGSSGSGAVPPSGGGSAGTSPSPGRRDRGRDRGDREKGSDSNNRSTGSTPTPSTAPTILYNAMGGATSSQNDGTSSGTSVAWQTSQEWDNRRLLQVRPSLHITNLALY